MLLEAGSRASPRPSATRPTSPRPINTAITTVQNVAKLAFLKILLLDLGISVGNTVTNFLQGFNLIWDCTDGTIRDATLYYGIAVILTSWLPSIFCLVHLWITEELENYVRFKGWLSFIPLGLLFIVFFPIMPTLLYLHLVYLRVVTREERDRYRRLENRAHEVKSIAGAIEAPLQLIIILWLLLKGILTMPFVEDSLGRIVCFPFIPMASIFFSTMSILKSNFDLNISPLLIAKNGRMPSLKQCWNESLRFTPFLLANVIFRVSTYAFIFMYLDFWAIIPCLVLLISNLIPQRNLPPPQSLPLNNPSFESQLPQVTPIYAPFVQNAFFGMFFPSCHIHLRQNIKDDEEFQKLLIWQRRIFQTQVVYFNFTCLLVISVVFILVTFVESYNYQSNTLNPCWFEMGAVLLVMMMTLSFTLALEPDPEKIYDTLQEIYSSIWKTIKERCSKSASSIDTTSKKIGGNLEDYTQNMEANTGEFYDKSEELKKRTIFKHTIFCLTATFIVLIPAVVGLIVCKKQPNHYIYLIQQNASRESVYDMTILTAFPITDFEYKNNIVIGHIDQNCFIDNTKSYNDKVIVVNQTSPKCAVISQDKDFLEKVYNSSAKALILLDNTPKYQYHWRVSSRHTASNLFFGSLPEYSIIPILMLRESDWSKFNSYLGEDMLLMIVFENKRFDLEDILPCTNSKLVEIGTKETNPTKKSVKRMGCSGGKHLYDNGTVSEHVCIASIKCSTIGQRCPQSYFENLRKFNVNLKCDEKSLDGASLDFKSANSEEVLKPAEMKIASGVADDYCCKNNGNETSTFVEVLGKDCVEKSWDVVHFMKHCKFTKYIKGECVKGQTEVSRFCKMPNHNCVIKEHYKTYCSSDQPLSHCEMRGEMSHMSC